MVVWNRLHLLSFESYSGLNMTHVYTAVFANFQEAKFSIFGPPLQNHFLSISFDILGTYWPLLKQFLFMFL